MKLKLLLIVILFGVAGVFAAPAHAQLSGSDPDSYRCAEFGRLTYVNGPLLSQQTGRMICGYLDTNGNAVIRDAILRPPTLRIVEVWFVRIIYILWAMAGIAFTASLIWIGFKYMTSFNNQYDLGKTIGDLRKWIIGLAIIFLSYPILVTVFRVLPLSNSQCYTDINMPGFQFFFPTVCESREEFCSKYPNGTPPHTMCLNGEID